MKKLSAFVPLSAPIPRRGITPLWSALLLGLATVATRAAEPVTLRETNRAFTLANGLVTARVDKANGRLTSLLYRDRELLAQSSPGGALGGYWSHVGRVEVARNLSTAVLHDPSTNAGERAEVAIRFENAPDRPTAALEMEIRFAVERGLPGVYTALRWAHSPGAPGFGVGEARFAMKLHPGVFDFLTIDRDRRRVMPTPADWDAGETVNLKEARRLTTGRYAGEVEHKYGYSAVIFDIPAYGWSSTRERLGLWFVNPSFEYMAGGPTKLELTGHLDVNPGGTPTLLNMWLGSHYGGSSLAVGPDERWSKFVGPFLLYCNAAPDAADPHFALWQDALARARIEHDRWPYPWVSSPDYPLAGERATLTGRVQLRDRFDPAARMSNVWVGVAAPEYTPPSPRGSGRGAFTNRTPAFAPVGPPPRVSWQRDAKFYQFWTQPDETGRFIIPHVRPGEYALHIFADGVLGDSVLTNVTARPGATLDLGDLVWQPPRFGRTLWEIGIPNRTAREFRNGDRYWHWGRYFEYTRDFPKDVDFVIGQSDWRRDWNYVQPPRIESLKVPVVSEADEDTAPATPAWRSPVQPSTWRIRFALTNAPTGTATLRLAFCGTHAGCNVSVRVNGETVGETGPLPSTSAMQRDGTQAYWVERPISFDAARLRAGTNVIELLSRATSWSQGVLYDCVRLELRPPDEK
ncbi:MAG: polysaccharide lyase family protein [Limisphaerales bacterium]